VEMCLISAFIVLLLAINSTFNDGSLQLTFYFFTSNLRCCVRCVASILSSGICAVVVYNNPLLC